MITVFIIVFIINVLFSVLTYGLSNAFVNEKYKSKLTRADRVYNFILSSLGIISFISWVLFSRTESFKYGWKL